MQLSIVVPVFNEEENLEKLNREIHAALAPLKIRYEVIYVDDGSSDSSVSTLEQLATDNPVNRIIILNRNFGQTAAMAAGFQSAQGAIIVPLDADLQNNPKDIPRLIEKINEGYDVVSGWRKNRKDKAISRKIPSMLANTLISKLTHVPLHDYGCTLKAYRKEVLERVRLYGELHRFVPALAYQAGAQVTEIVVDHRPRTAGKSKYGIDRTLRVVLDLMTVKFLLKYSTRPLQLFGKWAFGAFALSLITFAGTLIMKFSEGLSMNRNPLLVLSAFLLFSGVQFIALGLLGELVTRTYHEVQDKPIFTIRKKINFD
jgi:glycosyltransferase involved in cell wall biosynthesis